MVLLLVACATPPLQERPQPVSQSERIELIQSSATGSPDAEHVVGYAAMAAGVMVLTVLAIGFYKLARMLGGHGHP